MTTQKRIFNKSEGTAYTEITFTVISRYNISDMDYEELNNMIEHRIQSIISNTLG